jgi:hypothetical protein
MMETYQKRQYVTIAIWTALALLAYLAGMFRTVAFAPLLTVLGFWATMRMLND